MYLPLRRVFAVAAVCVLFCSCAEEAPDRIETYPVIGEVYVDGQPAANVTITAHNVKGIDEKFPTASSGTTDQSGGFEMSTYKSGDGLPAGDYKLTFEWSEPLLMSGASSPDKLKGRYADPDKSTVHVSVEPDKPTDLGRIDLTTK